MQTKILFKLTYGSRRLFTKDVLFEDQSVGFLLADTIRKLLELFGRGSTERKECLFSKKNWGLMIPSPKKTTDQHFLERLEIDRNRENYRFRRDS